jgi:hypothetical protein
MRVVEQRENEQEGTRKGSKAEAMARERASGIENHSERKGV